MQACPNFSTTLGLTGAHRMVLGAGASHLRTCMLSFANHDIRALAALFELNQCTSAFFVRLHVPRVSQTAPNGLVLHHVLKLQPNFRPMLQVLATRSTVSACLATSPQTKSQGASPARVGALVALLPGALSRMT